MTWPAEGQVCCDHTMTRPSCRPESAQVNERESEMIDDGRGTLEEQGRKAV
jgi:hypothetical protein